MKRCIVLFLLGILFSIMLPAEDFLRILSLMGVVFLILLLYIDFAKNAKIYQKVFSFVVGFFVGNIVYWQRLDLLTDFIVWQDQFPWIIRVATLAIMLFGIGLVWRQEARARTFGKQEPANWEDRNLFRERQSDLKRLEHYVKTERADILGIEGEWGSGKTFLVEGLKEHLQQDNSYELITVDVISIRLDRYADYLIRELDGVLRRNGVLSKNSTALRRLLAESKFKAFSFLWTDVETQYTKLFDDFREELLGLQRRIVIVYEDLDRIQQADDIRNIFYLSEKLTARNAFWKNSGIQIVYQYSAHRMQELGFSRLYLEKYIHCRMQLTKIDFVIMARELQEQERQSKGLGLKNSRCELSNDDLYRLPPHLFLPRNRPIPEEESWMDEYFSDKFTIRRTKQFLQELAVKMGEYSSRMEAGDRDLVIALCFIEYFLPEAYGKLDAENLSGAFVVQEEGKKAIPFAEACRSNWMIFAPQKHEQAFELYMAWRMLGLDAVKDEEPSEIQSVSDIYGWSMKQVIAAEHLERVNIQRMVRFFYESGKPFWNEYIYHANSLAERLLSEDKTCWPEVFQKWQQEMEGEKSGVRTLQRIGLSLWTEIVRAFGFASSKWTLEEMKTNYQNLFTLYQVLRDKTDLGFPRFFGQRFMEDWAPVWEGIPKDVISFRMMFEMAMSPKTVENYQNYDLFYVFAGRSMKAFYQNGFILQPDPWMYKPLFQNSFLLEKRKLCLEECIQTIDREIECFCETLKQEQVARRDPLPGGVPMYQSAQKYFSLLQKSLQADKQAKIQKSSHVMTKIIDVADETLRKIQSIEDDDCFYEAIRENREKVPMASLIDLIQKRNDKQRGEGV